MKRVLKDQTKYRSGSHLASIEFFSFCSERIISQLCFSLNGAQFNKLCGCYRVARHSKSITISLSQIKSLFQQIALFISHCCNLFIKMKTTLPPLTGRKIDGN